MVEFKVSGELFKVVTETLIIDKWLKGSLSLQQQNIHNGTGFAVYDGIETVERNRWFCSFFRLKVGYSSNKQVEFPFG